MKRLGVVVSGAASLVAMVLIIVVPPWALARFVGWPLPRSIPDIDSMGEALEIGVPTQVLVNILAVVLWVVWTQVALALLVEVAATLQRRPTIRIPVLPGVQALAARLVGGSLIVASSFQVPALAFTSPNPSLLPTPVAYVAPVLADLPPPPEPVPQPDVAPPSLVTVQPHDSYWAIAETHLGDGLRWREMRDANVGRRMADGHVISAADEMLRPGWVLLVPPAQAPVGPDPRSRVIAQRGDSLWSIAEDAVERELGRPPSAEETQTYLSSVVQANEADLPAGPDVIHAGQSIVLPPTVDAPAQSPAPEPPPPPPTEPEPEPESESAPEPPTVLRPPSPPVPSTPPDPHDAVPSTPTSGDASPEDGAAVAPLVLGGLTSAGLAVGAVAAIRRRRTRLSHRNPTGVATPTAEVDRPLHRALLHHADTEGFERLQVALASLARSLAEDGRERRPRVVQQSPDHVDVLLDSADDDPPAGWKLTSDGVWSLAADLDGAIESVNAAPLLVTIGAPDNDGQMYLDLEAERLVVLTGDEQVASDLARSIAVELALRTPSDAVSLIVVGQAVDRHLEGLGRATFVETWSDIADEVSVRVAQTSHVVSTSGWPTSFVGRAVDPAHDALAPLVVMAAEPPPPLLVEALEQHPHGTVAVVCLGEAEGPGTIIRCSHDELLMPAIGLRCRPQRVDGAHIEPLVRLVSAIDDDSQLEEPEAGTDRLDESDEPLESLPPPPVEAAPDYDVLVRLLGDITVEGGRRPLSPKPSALVAYIALHKDVSTEQLEEACWSEPGLTDHRRRLRDLVSQCRSAIGTTNLPLASDGRYRAGPALLTDIDLFSWQIERAERMTPADAAAAYRRALELVRGKVFTYPSKASTSYTWIDVENLVNQWEVRIAAVAERCATIYLSLGDPASAIQVVNHVATALPLHSGLTETLMRAHAAKGDQRAVRTTYASYVAAMDDLNLDVEPSVHEQYAALTSKGEP